MSLKILASLIILIAVVAHATKRQQRIAENSEKSSGPESGKPTPSAKSLWMIWTM